MAIRIVIAGGGTGGHLFPGIALAKQLKRHDMDIEITFVGTRQGIESRIVPKEGFNLKTIMSSGVIGKKGLNRWVSWCKIPIGAAQSMCFLIRKRPDLVVGVGGYSSGPVVLSSWLLRVPILIHEQNSVPGVTNKWLGKIADKVAVSFNESKKFFPGNKVVHTGNMVREEFYQPQEPTFQEPGMEFRLLILGGSQGAHSINMAMIEALDHLTEFQDSIKIVHQTGGKDFEYVRRKYMEKDFSANVQPFMDDMAEQVRQASLIICRSGATTLAEITATGKVSILIPFPHATHNHQEINARILEAAKASEVILDNKISGERLAQSIIQSIKEPEQLKEMEENSYRLGKRDATEKVKELCLQLTEDKTACILSCF